MTLIDELKRVREYLTNPPPANEANTCSWVIHPLLRQCEYDFHDIHEQGHDAAGNIPDYTLLPNDSYTWFLEAKAWQANITDIHINQAANYVNTTATRWFVVSNGREWRLYDNRLNTVTPPERLIATAKLDCGTQLEELLGALSKGSVQSGGLEKYARHTRLNVVLNVELNTPNSTVIQAIVNVLKGKSGLPDITRTDVTEYFHALHKISGTPLLPPKTPSAKIVMPSITSPASPPVSGYTLPKLIEMGDLIEGKKPQLLTFPDATNKLVFSWRDMAEKIIEWLFVRNKIPSLPFIGGKGNKCYLISTTPLHPTGNKMNCMALNVKGRIYYIDRTRSAVNYVSRFNALCQEVGEPPEGFCVTLK